MSVPKTEYMTANCHPQPPLQVYGEAIKHVTDFKYLGSQMASSASDFKRRKALAWGAFWKLERLWRSSELPISTKIKLFHTTCVTILLYGCESWVLSQDMECKINAFATSSYRVMLNIKQRDHVSNSSYIPWLTPNHLYTVLGSDSWVFLGMSFVSLKKSLSEDMLSIYHHMAKGDLDVHVPPTNLTSNVCWGMMKMICRLTRSPHLPKIDVHGEIL